VPGRRIVKESTGSQCQRKMRCELPGSQGARRVSGENVEFLGRPGHQDTSENRVRRDGKDQEGKLVIRERKELLVLLEQFKMLPR
jgi:hypothetical protein